ncbi:MAG: precorrin-4 C(11)-methyltransferase [Parvularculales bacterium]
MTVHFIGAGPGAVDLITVRGQNMVTGASVLLYAGSLVPPAIVALAPKGARVVDTASLTLDEIIAEMVTAHEAGHDVVRLHSGDPSLYGAIGEQMRRLRVLDIPYDVTPGVPAYTAAAAELGRELTLPGISQSVILTRVEGKASPMPNGETLSVFGQSGATLALHLSVRTLEKVVRELTPYYGADCPVAVVYRVGWPDQQILWGQLDTIRSQVRAAKITRTALILVGRVLSPDEFDDSRLYASDHVHLLRPHRFVKG